MSRSNASGKTASASSPPRLFSERLKAAVGTPVKAMRLRYLPLLMVYFAYGALGLVGIAESFWITSW